MSTSDAEMWENLRALQRRLAGELDGGEDEVESSWVIGPFEEIEFDDLPSRAKDSAKKSTGMGWETHAYRTVIHHEPVTFKNDGKTGRRGDVKVEAFDATEFQVVGVDRIRKIAFDAKWEKKSNGKSNAFVSATVADPIGVPTELFAKYEFDDQNAEYNDGTMYLPKKKFFKQSTPFADWLNDWVQIYATRQEEQ